MPSAAAGRARDREAGAGSRKVLAPAKIALLKIPVFLLCLLPLAKLGAEAFGLWDLSLGANPVEALIHRLGNWTLNFLLITLAVTPLRVLTGRAWLLRFRRMLGLFAFFYASLHFLAYAWVDQRFALGYIIEDIAERPYITLGFTALLLLLPLAVTSTRGWIRRLGPRWKKLHRLVYVAAILGVWHYYWLVKADVREPLVYAGILVFLLGFRLRTRLNRSRGKSRLKSGMTGPSSSGRRVHD